MAKTKKRGPPKKPNLKVKVEAKMVQKPKSPPKKTVSKSEVEVVDKIKKPKIPSTSTSTTKSKTKSKVKVENGESKMRSGADKKSKSLKNPPKEIKRKSKVSKKSTNSPVITIEATADGQIENTVAAAVESEQQDAFIKPQKSLKVKKKATKAPKKPQRKINSKVNIEIEGVSSTDDKSKGNNLPIIVNTPKTKRFKRKKKVAEPNGSIPNIDITTSENDQALNNGVRNMNNVGQSAPGDDNSNIQLAQFDDGIQMSPPSPPASEDDSFEKLCKMDKEERQKYYDGLGSASAIGPIFGAIMTALDAEIDETRVLSEELYTMNMDVINRTSVNVSLDSQMIKKTQELREEVLDLKRKYSDMIDKYVDGLLKYQAQASLLGQEALSSQNFEDQVSAIKDECNNKVKELESKMQDLNNKNNWFRKQYARQKEQEMALSSQQQQLHQVLENKKRALENESSDENENNFLEVSEKAGSKLPDLNLNRPSKMTSKSDDFSGVENEGEGTSGLKISPNNSVVNEVKKEPQIKTDKSRVTDEDEDSSIFSSEDDKDDGLNWFDKANTDDEDLYLQESPSKSLLSSDLSEEESKFEEVSLSLTKLSTQSQNVGSTGLVDVDHTKVTESFPSTSTAIGNNNSNVEIQNLKGQQEPVIHGFSGISKRQVDKRKKLSVVFGPGTHVSRGKRDFEEDTDDEADVEISPSSKRSNIDSNDNGKKKVGERESKNLSPSY